jgi:hypothetical protein
MRKWRSNCSRLCISAQRLSSWIGVCVVFYCHLCSATAQVYSIKNDQRVAQKTTLYLDCQAERDLENQASRARLQTSWNASLNAIKQLFQSDNGRHAEWALGIIGGLTDNRFTSKAPNGAKSVLETIMETELKIENADGSPHSGAEVINIPRGFVREECKNLMPSGDFAELLRQAAEVGRIPDPIDRGRELGTIKESSANLCATYLVRSTRYVAGKLFIVAHELAHVSLDPYSHEVVEAKGYQGAIDCYPALYFETRADMVGIRAVCDVPATDKIDEFMAHDTAQFSSTEISNVSKMALLVSFDDQLKMIQGEEPTGFKGCKVSLDQRLSSMRGAVKKLSCESDKQATVGQAR